jgi:hypothetical protein
MAILFLLSHLSLIQRQSILALLEIIVKVDVLPYRPVTDMYRHHLRDLFELIQLRYSKVRKQYRGDVFVEVGDLLFRHLLFGLLF